MFITLYNFILFIIFSVLEGMIFIVKKLYLVCIQ